MMDTLVRISTTQRRFAPTVSAIVGITVRNHRNTQSPLGPWWMTSNPFAVGTFTRLSESAIRRFDTGQGGILELGVFGIGADRLDHQEEFIVNDHLKTYLFEQTAERERLHHRRRRRVHIIPLIV